jgi:hypothetical protein
MKKLLFAAVALIALTTGSQATELPPCNDLATRKVFVNVVNTFNLYEFKEIENDDSSKRWCYAFFSGRSSTWTSHVVEASPPPAAKAPTVDPAPVVPLPKPRPLRTVQQ